MKNKQPEPERRDDTTTEGQHSDVEELESGWLFLTRNRSVNKMINGLLDLPPKKEFNQVELSEIAGVSRNSVGNHINKLLELQVIERVSDSSSTRYRLNTDSEVTELLIRLDGKLREVLQEPKQ